MCILCPEVAAVMSILSTHEILKILASPYPKLTRERITNCQIAVTFIQACLMIPFVYIVLVLDNIRGGTVYLFWQNWFFVAVATVGGQLSGYLIKKYVNSANDTLEELHGARKAQRLRQDIAKASTKINAASAKIGVFSVVLQLDSYSTARCLAPIPLVSDSFLWQSQ